jgi:hypothetical protein
MSNPMNITMPIPGVTLGPAWAQEINTIVETTIANHNHQPAQNGGVKLTQDALNITADLSLQNHKLAAASSVGLQQLVADPVSTNSIYDKNGDLYWNNAAGSHVRLTIGNAINVSTTNGITGLAANLGIASFDGSAFSWQKNNGSNWAAMKNGSVYVYDEGAVLASNAARVKRADTQAANTTFKLPSVDMTMPTALPINGTRNLVMTTSGVVSTSGNRYDKAQLDGVATTAGAVIYNINSTMTGTKPFIICIQPNSFTATAGDPSYLRLWNVASGVANTPILGLITIKLYNDATNIFRQQYYAYDPNNTGGAVGVYTNACMSFLYTRGGAANPNIQVILTKSSNNYGVELDGYDLVVYEVDDYFNP